MIHTIKIENYKSISKLTLDLGQVTVLIGANGSGKTNILEAIALASAAAENKLDNEFLFSRGIRVTEPELMRACFDKQNVTKNIKISIQTHNESNFDFFIYNENKSYSSWEYYTSLQFGKIESRIHDDIKLLEETTGKIHKDVSKYQSSTKLVIEDIEIFVKYYYSEHEKLYHTKVRLVDLINFLIYSPENTSLRNFSSEPQIEPLGIKGEGLFKLLWVLSLEENQDKFKELKEKMQLFDWFEDFDMPQNLAPYEKRIRIKDQYLDDDFAYFDQRSANEGFLFLLFYFTLFISDDTPKFFAIDNIEASLNPKLCRQLMKELVELAKKHDKKVILTTHNPAILDGLNLDDDEQRLYVVSRTISGYTKVKRILKPKPKEGQKPVRLSEAFLRGYIGGLPKGF